VRASREERPVSEPGAASNAGGYKGGGTHPVGSGVGSRWHGVGSGVGMRWKAQFWALVGALEGVTTTSMVLARDAGP
jgi:hypothetical protein